MINKDQKGQGFMEVIVAIGIMIIGIVSILILTSYNLTAADYGEKRLIASNLAREGIEVIRNIRDSNWVAGNDWDVGLPVDPATDDYRQIVKFSDTVNGSAYVLEGVEEAIDTCEVCKLYVTNTLFSHTDTGTYSSFKRQVEFRDICDIDIGNPSNALTFLDIDESCVGVGTRVGYELKSIVQWQASNGDAKRVELIDRIFDWR